MGGGQSGLPLWGSFAGEGAAGGGRLGRGRVAGSLVAPPWLKPCADAWVGSGEGCQGLRDYPAPGQMAKTYLTKPPWSGWRAGREGSPAMPLQGGGAPFFCPECKEDFGSDSVFDKHKKKV